ncbi:hypothetical protein L1987_84613 [Smallanthus sonchifolius]|uniref:Uncharacterized protein n=1 Tax=Smallanthus sonchifolius TaxID=185202 RepID=A0ACB8XUF2_9ASTR|nr:hypothetical protein L1987_84613 [Smallanthus sonchifolius]
MTCYVWAIEPLNLQKLFLAMVRCILAIEGTTTPISFVKDVPFPYGRSIVQRHLEETYDTEFTQDDIKLFRRQTPVYHGSSSVWESLDRSKAKAIEWIKDYTVEASRETKLLIPVIVGTKILMRWNEIPFLPFLLKLQKLFTRHMKEQRAWILLQNLA